MGCENNQLDAFKELIPDVYPARVKSMTMQKVEGDEIEYGLNLLSEPGNDLVASTALAASGCQIVLFTTGRETPVNNERNGFREIAIVGGVLIISSGLSILKLKDCKTLNYLPALLVPVLWFLLKSLLF